MQYEFTESHLILTFAGKARIRMTLDEADRLRSIIEAQLYKRDKQFKKVKEQQHADLVRRETRTAELQRR